MAKCPRSRLWYQATLRIRVCLDFHIMGGVVSDSQSKIAPQSSTAFGGIVDVFKLVLGSSRSDLSTIALILVLAFIVVVGILLWPSSHYDVNTITIVMSGYAVLSFILTVASFFGGNRKPSGGAEFADASKIAELLTTLPNSLDKMSASVEANSRAIRDISKSLPENLKFLDMVSDGRVDIRDPAVFVKKWTTLMSRADKKFFAVNFICQEVLASGVYDRCFTVLNDKRELGEIVVCRIFIVENEEECRLIYPIIEKHKNKGIDVGYVIKKNIDTLIKKYGFSPDLWSEGFVIVDTNTVVRFELENRRPAWFSVVIEKRDAENYQNLFDDLRGVMIRQPFS